MTIKVLCPNHDDVNPSAAVYGDNWYCFACRSHGHTRDLGLTYIPTGQQSYENVEAKIESILRLPKSYIRGLPFHYDDNGFYILWPDLSYYKYRLFNPTSSASKYRNPKGARQPPLVAATGIRRENPLLLVEGEINALTVAHCLRLAKIEELTVVSPGSAGSFLNSHISSVWPMIKEACMTFAVLDADATGKETALEFAPRCLTHTKKKPILISMAQDFSQIFMEFGPNAVIEEVKAILEKGLEVPRKLSLVR